MNKYSALIIGAGNQGALADAPKSGNEHKIISFAHALIEHIGFGPIFINDDNPYKSAEAIRKWKQKDREYQKKWEQEANKIIVKDFTRIELGTLDDLEYVDIAIITTPDDTHYEILKQLAEYPLKLVIVEKPICTNLHQAQEIVELYKAKRIPLMVDYTRRFIPKIEALKQYGKPTLATCDFNRGWLHTASHAIDFFNMLGAENIRIHEIPTESMRIWNINLYWNDYHWQEKRIGDDPVPEYYSNHMKYVAENAYNFLEGKEELKCTGEMALKSLEMCFELMNK